MDQSERRIVTFHFDDITKNPKSLVPSLMGFVRVRVRKREEMGIFLRAGKKRIFWRGFNKLKTWHKK